MTTLHRDAAVSIREDKKPNATVEYNRSKGGVDNLDKTCWFWFSCTSSLSFCLNFTTEVRLFSWSTKFMNNTVNYTNMFQIRSLDVMPWCSIQNIRYELYVLMILSTFCTFAGYWHTLLSGKESTLTNGVIFQHQRHSPTNTVYW